MYQPFPDAIPEAEASRERRVEHFVSLSWQSPEMGAAMETLEIYWVEYTDISAGSLSEPIAVTFRRAIS